MKTQVIVIHGGDAFSSYESYISFLKKKEITLDKIRRKDWKFYLEEKLGDGFEVIAPVMPCKANAKYEEWKIWFEKIIPLLDEKIILVGHSLGGIFVAKYLSENTVSKKILGTFLVAAPFDTEGTDYELCDFTLPDSLTKFEKHGCEIMIYQSADDPIVPAENAHKYKKALPTARLAILENHGHFNREEFPELVEEIRNLVK